MGLVERDVLSERSKKLQAEPYLDEDMDQSTLELLALLGSGSTFMEALKELHGATQARGKV